MKKNNLTFAGLILLAGFTACNDSGTDTNATTTTNTTTDSSTNTTSNTATSPSTDNGTGNPNQTSPRTPLSAQDSTFVMKAAMGGMMEVEAGNVAQQNGANDRVKGFATMMVNDHSKANSELMALAGGRGVTIPTTLPADMQKHMDAMRKMKGKAFDNHYMSMMVSDHQKTIADFQKQANGGADPELKAWAQKTLPVLEMHRDSATAINKAIK
jgi:putative membrane protein